MMYLHSQDAWLQRLCEPRRCKIGLLSLQQSTIAYTCIFYRICKMPVLKFPSIQPEKVTRRQDLRVSSLGARTQSILLNILRAWNQQTLRDMWHCDSSMTHMPCWCTNLADALMLYCRFSLQWIFRSRTSCSPEYWKVNLHFYTVHQWWLHLSRQLPSTNRCHQPSNIFE